jgi:hypothetical protein
MRIALSKLSPRGATEVTRQAILAHYESDAALIAAAGAPGASTVAAYRRSAEPLVREAIALGRSVWDMVEERAGNPNSWYTLKAAVQYVLIEKLQQPKQVIDSWTRAKPEVRNNVEARKAFELAPVVLVALANSLDATPTGGLPERFAGKSTRSLKSKSRSIQRRPENWREQIAETMTENLRLPYLIQAVTGCRNAELERGVSVVLLADGRLDCTIAGAKRGKHAGQESRNFKVDVSNGGVAAMLGALLQANSPVNSTALVANADSYRKAVVRASARVFEEKKAARQLSAYSLRHQFKKDISRTTSREGLAKAMGHATTRSACAYGSGGRAGASAVTPHDIKATRPIKLRSSFSRAPSATSSEPAAPAAKPRVRRPKP